MGYGTMRTKKPVKIELRFRCECGHEEPLNFTATYVHVVTAYTNESGTSWPMEFKITCPKCGGEWEDSVG